MRGLAANIKRLHILSSLKSQAFNTYFKITCRNFTNIRDHNFDYFRNNGVYIKTAVPKWDIPRLRSHISNFRSGEVAGDATFEIPLGNLLASYDIQTLQSEKLQKLIGILASACLNGLVKEIDLKELDRKCASNVNQWSLDSNLFIFDSFLILSGSEVFDSNYFKAVANLWRRNFQHCTKNQVVQILYFLGLSKKSIKFPEHVVSRKLEEFGKELSATEWGIVCLSLFRDSYKLYSGAVTLRVVEAARALMKNNDSYFHLISILKFLRLLQKYNASLMSDLQTFIKQEQKNFNFVECVNFLASLSSEKIYDKCAIVGLEQRAVKCLAGELGHSVGTVFSDHSHPSVYCRTKDLARFLWGLANIGHDPGKTTMNVVLRIIQLKFSRGEFTNHPRFLVDLLQSLAILNYYSNDLLQEMFSEKYFSKLLIGNRIKPRHQLYFLYVSSEIEHHEWQKQCPVDTLFLPKLEPLPADLNSQISKRMHLKNLLQLINKYQPDGKDISCSFVMPHIALAGIHIMKTTNGASIKRELNMNGNHINGISPVEGQQTCIEVLDPFVCCRNSLEPLGLMKAKLRQLTKLGYRVHVITPSEIDQLRKMPPNELKEKLSLFLE